MNKNNDLIFFEKVKKIEIIYPDKNDFVFYNDILSLIKLKINDKYVDISNFCLMTKKHKQVRFEVLLFKWMEKNNYIKNFSKEFEYFILPTDTYCKENDIDLKRTYNNKIIN